MPSPLADSDDIAQISRPDPPQRSLVVCFCADWCDTCRAYQPKFTALSEAYPDWLFVWVDIEEHPELLGEEDIENFPTLAVILDSTIRFFGPMLPHIGHLQRLLDCMDNKTPKVNAALPSELPGLLAAMANKA